MTKNYWLVKQEPESYSWEMFNQDGCTEWTGVRNFAARNNLRAMKMGDVVFYYHSGKEKAVVGIAKVTRENFADPTADEGDWSAVELAPVKPLKQAVTLAEIKEDSRLKAMALVKISRLSVTPVTEAEAKRILELGKTKL